MIGGVGFAHVHSSKGWSDSSRHSWFWRLDSRAKILGVFAFVLISAILTQRTLVFASLAISVLLAITSMVSPAGVVRSYLAALPFILLASVSVFLVAGTERGINMLARTSACVIPLLVLARGTETFDLFAGLRRLRVPALITTLLMLTHRYILLMSEELSRMSVARKARGFAGGRSLLDRYGLKVLSYTAGMVFVRTSGKADRAYEALRARGFDRDMTAWRGTRLSLPDIVFVFCFFFASVALVVFQFGVVL